MKRFRLSTLLLLVVIAALSLALVVQERRAARREADLEFRYAVMEHVLRNPIVSQMEGDGILINDRNAGRETKPKRGDVLPESLSLAFQRGQAS